MNSRVTFPRRISPAAALLLVLLGFSGCSTTRGPNDLYKPTDVGVLVIDAILIVDSPPGDFFITETLAPGTPYSVEAAAVRGATVVLTREDGWTLTYEESPVAHGRYRSDPTAPAVLPETRYTLTVEAPGGRRATATTITPKRFSVGSWVLLNEQSLEVVRQLKTFPELGDGVYTAPQNRVVYQQGLLEARIVKNGAPAYQVGLESLDLDSPRVIEADFLTEDDYAKLERNNSSPALEAANSTIRLPWFAIFWAGRYRIRVHAIDQNWYDYIRSIPQGSGGFGGNAGDNFERPLFHIDGGIGLFGSAASDSVGFVIEPKP